MVTPSPGALHSSSTDRATGMRATGMYGCPEATPWAPAMDESNSVPSTGGASYVEPSAEEVLQPGLKIGSRSGGT